MHKFDAGIFVNIGSSIQWFSTLVETGQWNDNTRDTARRFGQHLADDLRQIGCDISAQAAVRFADDVPDQFGIRPVTDLKPRAQELQLVIFSEMNTHLFFWVPPDRATYYEYPENEDDWNATEQAIERAIRPRFNKAASEINLARRCFALGSGRPAYSILCELAKQG